MDLGAAGLDQQPFPAQGKPVAIIPYASEREAIRMLRATYVHPTGLSLLQGPNLAGKSTLIGTFVESLHTDCAVAIVEGRGLNASELLVRVLQQFGYDVELNSTKELLGLIRVFVLQQAASGESPLLVVNHVHELKPSALRAVCELAELRVRNVCALKIVLVSDRPLAPIIESSGMAAVADRLLENFHLHPMSRKETALYLHTKLRAAGREDPESIFPNETCEELWRASGGWPGILDRIALLALAKAEKLPVPACEIESPALPGPTWSNKALAQHSDELGDSPQPPHIVVTNNGSVMQELTMDTSRLLIGRSEHNDISISSRFVSRHHALIVRHRTTTFLMDLNSTNGTFVNSRRVSNHVLRHEDIVTLGHHKIKFYDPFATPSDLVADADFADTAVMKSLEDMRNLLAKENTALLPATSEDLPTVKT